MNVIIVHKDRQRRRNFAEKGIWDTYPVDFSRVRLPYLGDSQVHVTIRNKHASRHVRGQDDPRLF